MHTDSPVTFFFFFLPSLCLELLEIMPVYLWKIPGNPSFLPFPAYITLQSFSGLSIRITSIVPLQVLGDP